MTEIFTNLVNEIQHHSGTEDFSLYQTAKAAFLFLFTKNQRLDILFKYVTWPISSFTTIKVLVNEIHHASLSVMVTDYV